jgi:hypothetical protein
MFTYFIGRPKIGFKYPYKIDQSCRFNDDDSAYLSQTFGTNATNQYKHTFSTWVKRCNLSSVMTLFSAGTSVSNYSVYQFSSGNTVKFTQNSGGVNTADYSSNPVLLRDTAAWYHIFAHYDSANATAGNRLRLWVNGVELSLTATVTLPINTICRIGDNADTHAIGKWPYSGVYYLDGYLTETIYLDGTLGDVNDFGEIINGIWVPKQYTGGSYGTNGFYLDYSNASNFGEDQSGNNNDFTDSGLATTDQFEDTPTNNHCTLNSNTMFLGSGGTATIANGNLDFTSDSANDNESVLGTMAIPANSGTGFYFEVEVNTPTKLVVGVFDVDQDYYGSMSGKIWVLLAGTGYKYHTASTDISGTIGVAERMQVAVKDGKIWFGKEGSWFEGDPAAGTGESFSGLPDYVVPYIGDNSAGGAANGECRFAEAGWQETPPTGFKAINFENVTKAMKLNENLYLEGNKGMDVVLYEGDGTASQAITGLEFSPDLVWIKNRDAANTHVLNDTVRGARKQLYSNLTTAETDKTGDPDSLQSFDSNGFTIGYDNEGNYNSNAQSYVAWNWLESPDYGFDIVSYTGTGVARTVAHNLGVTPGMIIVKNRDAGDATDKWFVYHKDNTVAPETDYLVLNDIDATADLSTIWNDTAPTSAVFSVGTGDSNVSGEKYIAYLFASIEGYSKIFSYTGNGNINGPFIYCGFRPRYILVKNKDRVQNWYIIDTSRNSYNVTGHYLIANDTNVEAPGTFYDIVSNGFKVRNSSPAFNASGEVTIGIAFAETPFPWANAR